MKVQASPGEWKGAALVRGPDGRPKFDSILGIDYRIWSMLTDDEKREIQANGGYSHDSGT
jgi:hypothetical protein